MLVAITSNKKDCKRDIALQDVQTQEYKSSSSKVLLWQLQHAQVTARPTAAIGQGRQSCKGKPLGISKFQAPEGLRRGPDSGISVGSKYSLLHHYSI